MRFLDKCCKVNLWAAALVGITTLASAGAVTLRAQQSFASPEDAVAALSTAVKARDRSALGRLFGPQIREFLSGDPVADANAFEEFADNLASSVKFETAGESMARLVIGEDDWPFAFPIIKVRDSWRFDTEAGIKELIGRRIGENEIAAISSCQEYAVAQFEYFNRDDWDGDQVSEYAQKIASTVGKKDGLFWEAPSDEEDESPLGALFAYAAEEGYKAKSGTTATTAPFRGYHFKVLYGQGPSAPGGRFRYVINGNMIAGFALVAYPATWGNSGIMTFVVNQEGRVYEKNLGPRTVRIAAAMTEYNPDVSWSLASVDYDFEPIRSSPQ